MSYYFGQQKVSAGPPPFDPTSIPGLILWHRASLGVTSSGGLVSQWNDSSGTGDPNKNVTAAGTFRPTLHANNPAYNNRATIDFSYPFPGSHPSQRMESGLWAVPLSNPYTVFVVAHQSTFTNIGVWSDPTGSMAVDILTPSVGVGPNWPDSFSGAGVITDNAGNWNVPSVVCSVFDQASSALYFNSHLPAVTGSLDPFTLPQHVVGTYDLSSGTARNWNGPIGDIIVYDHHLTAGEITTAMNGLGSYYAIAIA